MDNILNSHPYQDRSPVLNSHSNGVTVKKMHAIWGEHVEIQGALCLWVLVRVNLVAAAGGT